MLQKTASSLAAVTAMVHFLIGGRDALAPMLAAEMPLPAEGAMHSCWHMITFLLVWSVVVFWNGGKPAFHFGILWVASSVVFLYVGFTQAGLQGLVINPQWTILGVTGVVALFSCRFGNDHEGDGRNIDAQGAELNN